MHSEDVPRLVPSVDDVLVTPELSGRVSREPDYEAEAHALNTLSRELASRPEGVLQILARLAMELCRAESAGINILEPGGDKGVFRWLATTGAFDTHSRETMARDASPCGTVLDRKEVLLFREAERCFPAMCQMEPGIFESLLVPWIVQDEPAGTLWVAHDTPEGRFDGEDARLLASLAPFASVAWQMQARHGHRAEMQPQVREHAVELQQSRDLLQATMDSSIDMIQVFEAVRNERGEIVDFLWLLNNQTSESKYGETGGQSLLQSNPGVIEEGLFDAFKRVVESGSPVQAERHYAHEQFNGWFFQSIVKLGDGVAMTTREITVEKQALAELLRLRDEVAQSRLRETEQNLYGVANVVPDLLWYGESDGATPWYNDRWLQYTGQTLAQAIVGGWTDTIHPEDREASAQGYHDAVAQRRPFAREHRIRRHDGEYRWFLVRAEPLLDEQGRVRRMYGAATDIHDQRLALEALRQSEERLQMALDIETVGVLFIRLDGQIHHANDAFLRMSGYDRDELRNLQEWAVLTAPGSLGATRHAFAEIEAEGVTAPYEREMVRPDGSSWWGLVASTRLGGQGHQAECVEFIIDITGWKVAQAALRVSEEQFRCALEEAPIPVIMHAEDGQVLQISRTWTDLTGFQPEDLPTFEAWLSHAYGEGADAVRQHMRQLFAGKKRTVDIEFPVRTRTGEQRHWSFSASSPGTLIDGRRFIVGMAVDITARKQAEEALRVSEERFRLLVDNVQEYALFQTDLDGRVTSWNPGAARLFGYSTTEMPGQPAAWLLSPEDQQASVLADELARVAGGEHCEDARWLRRRDGTRFWARWVAEPVRDATGQLRGVARVLRDETERMRTDAALQTSEARLRVAIEAAALGHWDWDVVADRVRWEPLHNRLLGLPPEQEWGDENAFLACVHPEDRSRVQQTLSDSVATGQPFECVFRTVHADGGVRWIAGHGHTLTDGRGRTVRMIGVVRDITAQRQAEEAIRNSLSEKEELLKEVHHRVKNNLQVIISLINLQTGQIHDARVLALLDETRNRVYSIATIHELIYRSASFANIDITEYTRQLVPDLVRFHGCEDRIHLTIEGEGASLELERAVPFGLLLNELASNVCKHAFPEERTGDLRIRVYRQDGHAVLEVADTGVGLASGFDYRSSESLGLQLVHGLARQLRASVEISSEAGTQVVVRIPQEQQ